MATPNASQPMNGDLALVEDLLVLARKTPLSYARQQMLLLILSTLQAVVQLESSPHPSFYNAFESSGGPSGNPEVQDDGENEGEDGEDVEDTGEDTVEDTGEDTVEDTGEDTVEDTRQPVVCRRKWYTLLPREHPYCDAIPRVHQSEVRPHIMTRLTQMLNGTVNVYEVERVWFNHQADGWNVVFTFQRSPLNHAYPIRFKEGWMKVGHLHIKESFPSLA
jgi:hypothetical protein